MICPRCGQRIPAGLLERCPICGQPFYPPMTKTSRVIKLPPEESEPQPASESDADDGADTLSLPMTQSATVGRSRLVAGGLVAYAAKTTRQSTDHCRGGTAPGLVRWTGTGCQHTSA